MAKEKKELGVAESGEIESGMPAPTPSDPTGGKVVSATKGKMIEVDADQFAGLMSRVSELETKTAYKPPKRVTDRTARMAFVDDMPVIDFDEAVEKPVPGSRDKRLFINITLLTADGNKRETREVDYLIFLNEAFRFKADILKQTARPWERFQGGDANPKKVEAADPVGMRERGERAGSNLMPLTESGVDYTSLVKFLEGPWVDREIEVENKVLNI